MAEILSLVSLISFIAAGISFVLAVFFFIKFKIPTVIGDLSGRTARKSIAKMRENNEKSGNKSYRPSSVNVNRGKLTDNMPKSDELKTKDGKQRPETGLLDENKVLSHENQQTAMLYDDDATKPLAGDMETEMLVDYDATGRLNDDDETDKLNDDNATMPLDMVNQKPGRPGGKTLVMLDEVMLIHTDEVIR